MPDFCGTGRGKSRKSCFIRSKLEVALTIKTESRKNHTAVVPARAEGSELGEDGETRHQLLHHPLFTTW